MQFIAEDYRDENGNVPDQTQLDYTVALMEVAALESESPNAYKLIPAVGDAIKLETSKEDILKALKESFDDVSPDARELYRIYYSNFVVALKKLKFYDPTKAEIDLDLIALHTILFSLR